MDLHRITGKALYGTHNKVFVEEPYNFASKYNDYERPCLSKEEVEISLKVSPGNI